MFQEVKDADFVRGEHDVLKFWEDNAIFRKRRELNAGKPRWSFLDGPITANNPMGVHHAWGRTYKDTYQRFFAMLGYDQRYQNGFDCQGLWVEVEVEKQLGLGTKTAVAEYGIDNFVNKCKSRVLTFAARQTEQSKRLGYWMDWDDPEQLRLLAAHLDPEDVDRASDEEIEITTPAQTKARGKAREIAERLGCPEWGGSYFTFSTENNETIWTFLKKCFQREKVYQGHDVMPWSGRGGSAYSQMEIAEGRKLTTHKSVFVRFPLRGNRTQLAPQFVKDRASDGKLPAEYLLIWTTTPWTLTSNVAVMMNPDLEYVAIQSERDGAVYYFAKDNLNFKRLEREFKEGFGRPEWQWPKDVPKLKTIAQIFKEQGGFEELGTVRGDALKNWEYDGPFDDLAKQQQPYGDWDRWRLDEVKAAHAQGSSQIEIEFLLQRAYPALIAGQAVTADDEEGRPSTPEERLEFAAGFAERLTTVLVEVRPGAFKLGVPVFKSLDDVNEFLTHFTIELNATQEWNRCLAAATRLPQLSENEVTALLSDQQSVIEWIRTEVAALKWRSPAEAHQVIDGGRDSRGNAHVVAGEGTGLVHTAPGCGDIDHKIGMEAGLPIIAPLKPDGTFSDGFGDFSGREAIAPETAELVFDKLKNPGEGKPSFLVYVETYPHIYPHCWRTGDELVFRLVDEWFINMDWREEIKDVTRQIDWLPQSINGQERECEWLSLMGDWMISKKRFWGLALPIWVNENDPTDFEVIGSLAELKERAVEGWDGFEGNTPHRPWIDGVVIESSKNPGQKMRRIEDVGNPWLDAGIVPFSTMHYNHDHDEWQKWYPADLVTECFPGQFRNWFYSMLSLSTMMRFDETDDPKEKRPFKTLLGHRLVQNEQGQPMHKSDGTAIWFEEAAEQLGVDTMRWMYLAQNPATDLRFGTRHPDEPVTLATPDGPQTETKEGVTCCKVTSSPADEVRRRVLIPLWNSYAFFVNYARLDDFDPNAAKVPVADRPEIDRWILSNLHALLKVAADEMPKFNVAAFCRAAEDFLDDLTNWYIRRNRRRFWRSKPGRREHVADITEAIVNLTAREPESAANFDVPDAMGGDKDKLAAYQTLYEVLVTLCKALAPCIPFLTERMYQNLCGGFDTPFSPANPLNFENRTEGYEAKSVHLCDYPTPDDNLLDPTLNARTATAQLVVRLGHKLREEKNLRVRLPLSELQFACSSPEQREAIEHLADVIREELNIKQVTSADHLDELVHYSYKPNLKTLGPKYGKLLGAIRNELPNLDPQLLAPLRSGQNVTVELGGESVELGPDDVMVSTEQASDWSCADEAGIQIAISTVITPELEREGTARDFVRQVQQLRKDHDLDIQDRIQIGFSAGEAVNEAVAEWADYIKAETLADSVAPSESAPDGTAAVTVGAAKATIWITAAQ